MANVTVGCMVANNLVPTQTRQAGALNWGPYPIPAGFGFFSVMFDLRSVITLTVAFTSRLEISYDNGATWVDLGGGGLEIAKSGFVLDGNTLMRGPNDALGPGPVRCFGDTLLLPRTDLATRQIRGTLSQSERATSGATVLVW